MIIIKNDSLTIRQFTKDDLHDLNEMENNIKVMQGTSIKRSLTLEESQERLNKTINSYQDESSEGIWAVEKNQKVVAWVMMKKTEFDSPEVGYMVNESFWGQGIASSIVDLVIEYANSKGINILYAVTDTDNFASQRVLEKCSFQLIEEKDKLRIFKFS